MKDKDVIETLNEFLKGKYMGIHAYEQYIEKVKDLHLKEVFQQIQINHKQHAIEVAKRIQDLGGIPVDDEGLIGSVTGTVVQWMIPDKPEDLIDYAREKEDHYAVHVGARVVEDQLDAESLGLIKRMIEEDKKHVDQLQQLRQLL